MKRSECSSLLVDERIIAAGKCTESHESRNNGVEAAGCHNGNDANESDDGNDIIGANGCNISAAISSTI